MKLIFIVALFHIILNKEIPIEHFEEVEIEFGISNFSYIFSPKAEEGNEVTFYFKLSNYSNDIHFDIIDENENVTEIKIGNYWTHYQFNSKKQQKFIFHIINVIYFDMSMKFIDSTLDINLSFDQFINFNFKTDEIYKYKPKPLTFNINEINEETVYYFRDYNYLEYCIKKENDEECELSPLKEIKTKKGQKYKIVSSCHSHQNGTKLYYVFEPLVIIKEIDYGITLYTLDSSINERYYINKIKTKNLYIYSNNYYYMEFISEDDKIDLSDSFDSLSFNRQYQSNQVYIKTDNDNTYLVIKITNSATKSFIYLFDVYITTTSFSYFEINKGQYAAIYTYINANRKENGIIVSSNKNINYFSNLDDSNNLQNILFLSGEENYIYVNSLEEKTFITFYTYSQHSSLNYLTLNLYENYVLNNYLNKYGPDSMFMRCIISDKNNTLETKYLFGIEEKYYLYNKKYFGYTDIYQNQNLNVLSDILQFYTPFNSYESINDYKLINNELLIISGYQLFTLTINYNSLFDFYIQKVEDSENININSEMSEFNNLIKLLNEKKIYNLNFTLDHLIKLDNKFTDAVVTFTDDKGKEYVLNKEQRIIDNLKGENIKVSSTKNALIYFYKRIPNYSEKGILIFDKSKKGQNMKFVIKYFYNSINIAIAKDFGFPGYYPFLRTKYWENITSKNNTATIFIENYYDKANYTIDEEESYIIYIFDLWNKKKIITVDSMNYKIENVVYIKNLLAPGNKYNFQVIPANSEGSLILNPFQNEIKYNLFSCNNKPINFKIQNYSESNYIYNKTITQNNTIYFKTNSTLVHTFESESEFLFMFKEETSYYSKSKYDYDIMAIKEIKKNIIRVKFTNPYFFLNRFYIIVSKKDENNNINSFSNLCYVANLMINNSNSIVIKTFYQITDERKDLIIADIDISKLSPKENDMFVISIIDDILFTKSEIEFFKPKEFRLKQEKEPIEIKIGETTKFDLEKRNYFKFEYLNKDNREEILLIISDSLKRMQIILYEPESEGKKIIEFDNYEKKNFFKISKSGIYYLELYSENYFSYTFTLFISFTETIDLSKKIYYNNLKFRTKVKSNPIIYKVTNLKEDRAAYFFSQAEDYYSYDEKNPFEICNDNTNECKDNIVVYKFLKENNYTIYVKFIEDRYNKDEYKFPMYLFFPIFEDTFEEKEEGYYIINDPKIFKIDYQKHKYLFSTFSNQQGIYRALTNKNISLDDLGTLRYQIISSYESYIGYNYAIIIIIPKTDNPTKYVLIDEEMMLSEPGEYHIPSGQNSLIYININNKYNNYAFYNKNNPLSYYNTLVTFSSPFKNMLIINSDFKENEGRDFIIQNYFGYPIYVNKSEKDFILTIKEYEPRYSFFAAADNQLLGSYLDPIFNKFQLSTIFDKNIIQTRLNTDLLYFYDFFNLYFYDMKGDINIFFKQYYGNSQFYESKSNIIDKNDFSFLTKPYKISKNETSVMNKMVHLKGDKLLMGYIDYNSYLDIYIEIENNDTNIEITNMMKSTFQNTAKYLKKDVEYTLYFNADHLVKLERGFDAEISIYNDSQKIMKLNPSNPTLKIQGEDFKIKANNNALVYFYGKFPISRMKIDPNKIGKNLEIKIDSYIMYVVDIGFEDYSPSEFLTFSYNRLEHGGNIYISNIYDKLKVPLYEGEYLYFYYIAEGKFELKYTQNINHKNNEFTFNYIHKNSQNQTLIINNAYKEKIRYQVYFCNSPHEIKVYYQGAESPNEILLEFNNETTVLDHNISYHPHKLRFKSEKDFIFSYSLIDDTDSKINNYQKWIDERVVLTNLTIEDIIKKYPNNNHSDIFTIKFTSNYRNSSTRYIIIIASNDENNTIDSFNNPCYITQLVNERPNNVKIVNFVEIGEDDSIEIEVDIKDILGETDQYIVNIISQELRFEKKLNFYEPMIFTHRKADESEKKDNDNNNDLDISLILIISISSGVFIILVIIIIVFCVISHKKRSSQNIEVNNVSNVKLLKEF